MPRLSFSLRDVFWLTLVVGMGVGWWVDRHAFAGKWRSRLGALEWALRSEGVAVKWNIEHNYVEVRNVHSRGAGTNVVIGHDQPSTK